MPKSVPLRDRFARSWEPVTESGCWLWTAAKTQGGYGALRDGRGGRRAHRISWELNRGAIPEGLHVLHKCDTPLCVNPDHLFLGTHRDNMEDRRNKGRANNATGEGHWSAKITADMAIAIAREPGMHKEVAKKFGVPAPMVGRIKKGHDWSSVTGIPKRLRAKGANNEIHD